MFLMWVTIKGRQTESAVGVVEYDTWIFPKAIQKNLKELQSRWINGRKNGNCHLVGSPRD